RIKVAENWSNSLGGVPLAFIHKTRDITRPNASKANRVVGEVEGRTCVLVDDMIDTGGTIVQAADACMAAGAKGVIVVSTHAVFSGPAVERLSNSVAEEVIVTNTLPLSEDKVFDKLTVLSIAPLIGRAVHEVFEDGSVTSLFRAEEHTSELQSRFDLVCRLLLEKKKTRGVTGNSDQSAKTSNVS